MSSYWRNLAWPLIALLALGACAQYSLISVERIEIAGAYSVSPSIKWNSKRGRDYELWTVDGPKLQDLTFYGGFEDDDILFAPTAKQDEKKIHGYKENFSLLDVEEWIEASYAQAEFGNMVTTDFRPFKFGSKKGFRFEFTFVAEDGLRNKGFVVGAKIDAELHLIVFTAPELYYFEKFAPEAERIIRSIRIAGDGKAA